MWKNAENVEKDLPPNPQVLYGWGKQEGSCPKCGLKEFGNSTVEMHIKRDHPRTPQGAYSCWICPYTFRKQGQFVAHHREGHAGEKMACWVCGEKKWSSTALVYGHIKRDHPGYRKGVAHQYFAALKNKTGKVPVVPSMSSQATSSSYFDSLSDSTSMDSYYSEYDTDFDDDGAPIFCQDEEEATSINFAVDSLVDEDGAPILESLTSPHAKPTTYYKTTKSTNDNAKEKTYTVPNIEDDSKSLRLPSSSSSVNETASVEGSLFMDCENGYSILGI